MARPDQLSRIKDLVEEGKLDQAREEALGFIQYDLPEGREIHLVQTAGRQKIPAYSCLTRWVMFSCLSFT